MTGGRFGIWLLSTLIAGPSFADTLQSALEKAKGSNPAILAAQSGAAAAQAAAQSADRLRYPVVTVSGSLARLDHSPMLDMATPAGRLQSPQIFKDDQIKSATADLTIPLFTSGRIQGAIDASRAEAAASAATAIQTRSDVGLSVVSAYLDVLRARRAETVTQARVRALESHQQTVAALYAREGVPKTDALTVEVALANARADDHHAHNAVRTAEDVYVDLVGGTPGESPDLEEPGDETPIGRGDLGVLFSEALDRRADLRALVAQRDALNDAAVAERGNSLPQIGVRAGWQHMDTQILDRADVASVGIGFEWKLFDSGQTAARVSALHFRAKATDRLVDSMRLSIRRELSAALRSIEDARSRLVAGDQAVESAEENLRLATRLYETGLTTNTSVLEALAARADAQMRQISARYDVTLADYQMRHALGRL